MVVFPLQHHGEKMRYFKNIRNDLDTYDGNWGCQGFWAMLVYRFGRWRYTIKVPLVRKFFSMLYKFFFKGMQIITGIELPCEVNVGRNFRIDHFGDIIISGYASFGDNCIVRNGVTVGLKNIEEKIAIEQAKLEEVDIALSDPSLYDEKNKMQISELVHTQGILRKSIQSSEEDWITLSEELESLTE